MPRTPKPARLSGPSPSSCDGPATISPPTTSTARGPRPKFCWRHALGLRRIDLYLRYDQPLLPTELAAFKALIQRRAAREPVAYIVGRKEFWSLELAVTRRHAHSAAGNRVPGGGGP